MTRAEMLAELRLVIDDTVANYGWSDTTLLGYLAEGQDKFCEETGFFVDNTNYTITLETGVKTYAIPARAIEIMEVWDDTRRLQHFQQQDRGRLWSADCFTSTASTPGLPYGWQADEQTGTLTLDRAPTAAENGRVLTLRLWRYSRYALDDNAVPVQGGDPTNAEPEIPGRFQRACIEWAAFKAYSHHDAEQGNKIKAADHLAAFRIYTREGRAAHRRLRAQDTVIRPNPIYVV